MREKFYIPDKTRQLSLEPLYVGTKSSLPRATRDAETQDRTGDLQIFSLTLSQLSYRGPVVDKRTGGYNAALVATTRRTSTPTTSGKWNQQSEQRSTRTVWPSGLRRWLQAPVRKGVGSNPTAVISKMLTSGCAVTSGHILKCWSSSQTPGQLSIERQAPSGAIYRRTALEANPSSHWLTSLAHLCVSTYPENRKQHGCFLAMRK